MEEFDQVDILLVEDNPLDAELTLRGLRQQKVANNITWVKDGEEALNYVFRRGAYAGHTDSGPRLILLDLKMPRVGGIDVAGQSLPCRSVGGDYFDFLTLTGGRFGFQTMCEGGGQANATVIERLD